TLYGIDSLQFYSNSTDIRVIDNLNTATFLDLITGLTDTDSDGIPNECDEACVALGMTADTDDDNDGVLDAEDVFPLDANKSTLLDDDISPVVIAPSDLYIDATGEFTMVSDLGVATASDNLEIVTAVLDNSGPYPAGESLVTWSAVDSAGNQGQDVQTIFVRPIAQIAHRARMAINDVLTVPVRLSGEGYNYPVIIPISVSSDAVLLSTTEVEILSGTIGVFDIEVIDSELSGQFVVTLGTPSNAALSDSSTLTVSLIEEAVSPKVSLLVSQNEVLGRYITQTDSEVAIEVVIEDVNGNHALGWDIPVGLADIVDTDIWGQLRFNPKDTQPGTYKITVKVEDDGLPGELFTRSVSLKISGLTRISDSDNDGVPDDLDITVTPNAIELGSASNQVAQASAGVKLSLGNVAADTGGAGIFVTETELPVPDVQSEFPLGLLDFEAELSVPGDSLALVVPLLSAIPQGATYRKLINGTWRDFVVDEKNTIASTGLNSQGGCPSTSSADYISGLTEGDMCLLLTVEDGGPNDADAQINGHVVDPGGIAVRDETAGIAPYTLLEQPTPQFASLSPTAKIIVTSSEGENFFDVAKYIPSGTADNPVSVVGETFLISGSSDIDGFMMQPGVKYDLTNLKGGIDKLYFSGPLAEYADSILLDSATGVMQVSRLTDVGEEIVQFIATASAADMLIFTDGALSTELVKAAVSAQTPLTDLTLDTSIKALDDKTITGATVKHIVLSSEGGSVMGLGPSIKTLISGNSGIDQIYVPAGSIVDASNLKSGRDEITVEGNLADYDIRLNSSGNIVLNREIDIDDVIHTESVTIANGGNVATNDLVIFADQQLDTSSIKQQL
ncbi:hypothetical protein, partial [Opacimonas viscosa]